LTTVDDERSKGGPDEAAGRDGGPERASDNDLGADVEARARRIAGAATRSVVRFAARAREELEDIWAEARDRRAQR
jgi:hypothetical protein